MGAGAGLQEAREAGARKPERRARGRRPHDSACDRRVHEAETIKNVLYLSKVLVLNNSK